MELSETLAETRADLEDFQQSSKELEEEMNLEIIRTEKSQQELKTRVARVETERDEWKVSCRFCELLFLLSDARLSV